MHIGDIFECWDNGTTIEAVPISTRHPTHVTRFVFDGKGIQVSNVKKGEVKRRGEYFHALLDSVETEGKFGAVLKVQPYKPCPYPDVDIDLHIHLLHTGDNKVWAISSCGNYSFIRNDNTNGRLVCCALNASKTLSTRVDEKLEKGYLPSVISYKFLADSRSLK